MSARVILKMHTSLDGFVCTPDGDESWLFPHFEEQLQQWEVEGLQQAGVHVMGRKLYDVMAAYWPTSTEPYAPPMNHIPKVVFSRSLQSASWGETRIARSDLAEEITRLKHQTVGDILAHGGAAFAQSLSQLNLVDEYRLLVHPIALGEGRSCFRSRVDLQLVASRVFPSGVVALTYCRN